MLLLAVVLMIALIPKSVQVHYQTTRRVSSISHSTCLLSFPHSGNHLVRFIGEFVTARPSLDCFSYVQGDTTLSDEMKTNFLDHVDQNRYPIFHKYHSTNRVSSVSSYCSGYIEECSRLLLVLRDPYEAILDWCEYQSDDSKCSPEQFEMYARWYFDNIQFYVNFLGPKGIIRYDDLVTSPNITKVLKTIYTVTDNVQIPEKVEWLKNPKNYKKFRKELYQVYESLSFGGHDFKSKYKGVLIDRFTDVLEWVKYLNNDKVANFVI